MDPQPEPASAEATAVPEKPPSEVPPGPKPKRAPQAPKSVPAIPEPPVVTLDAGSRRVEIGEVAPESQIAVRGHLVIVATRSGVGKPNEPAKPGTTSLTGGVHVFEASSSELKELFVAPSPPGFDASGVALVDDSVFYVLNETAPGGRRSTVVKLGLDGGVRWVRELDQAARSLPVVWDSAVWVLVAGKESLSLRRLDADSGLPVDADRPVSKCAADTHGRVYALGSRGNDAIVIWCELSSPPRGESGRLVAVGGSAWQKQQALPPYFTAAPQMALGQREGQKLPDWIFSGPIAPELPSGKPRSGSLRCRIDYESAECSYVYPDVWGPEEAESSLSFPLRTYDGKSWTRLTLSESGALKYGTPDPRTDLRYQLSQKRVATASLCSFGNLSWWLVVAGDGVLSVYDTRITGVNALERFPRGDLALRGVMPTWVDLAEPIAKSELFDATELADAARQNGSGSGFRLEKLPVNVEPSTFTGSSNRTLFAYGGTSIPAPVFDLAVEPKKPPTAPAPVARPVLGHVSGDRWYFEQGDTVWSIQRASPSGGPTITRVWPAPGETNEIRGFDAAGGSIAVVTKTAALWCLPPSASTATLDCETVLVDDLPGPVALSLDGRTYWLALGNGNVRRWYRAAPQAARSEALGIEPKVGELTLLRAFDSELFVGGESSLASYTLDAQPKRLRSQKFRPELVERCDGTNTFALNDGQLVYASGDSEFEVVRDQPAFTSRIACDGAGNLLGVSSRFGAFKLDSPPGFPWRWLLTCAGIVAAVAVSYVAHARFNDWGPRRGDDGTNGGQKPQAEANRIFDRDSPKESLSSGTQGQQALVRALRDFLDSEATLPPLTVGVYGAWGSGKSSIMRMLNDELQKKGRYVTVWFNAWRHQQESQLGPALLQSIVREFRRQAGARVRLYSLASALLNSRRTFYWGAGFVSLALSSYATYEISNDKRALLGFAASIVPFWKSVLTPLVSLFRLEPADAGNKSFSERIGFLQEFSEEFERVVGSLPKNNYLAIFVDDLDRCPPNRVANVLEALNRLMESRLCFVILGMDPETVRHSVELRYQKLISAVGRSNPKRAANFGNEFLEKLVGIAVSVPPVPASEVDAQQVHREQTPERNPWRVLQAQLERAGSFLTQRLDQVFVTSLIVVGALTAFSIWRQDPTRVETWVRAALAADASSEPAKAASAAEAKPDSAEPVVVKEAAPLQSVPSAAVPVPPASADAVAKSPPNVPEEPETKQPPAHPAPGASAQVPIARFVELAPEPPKPEQVARVERPHPRSLAREFETATTVNRYLQLGLAALASLGFLLIAVLFWQDLRAGRRMPPYKDSPAFAKGLSEWSATFKNPRQRVRFKNLARLTYHLVAEARPNDATGWESTFFAVLAAQLKGESYLPPPGQGWILPELTRWLDRIAPTSAERAQQEPGTAPA